jgi:hypothetical protein
MNIYQKIPVEAEESYPETPISGLFLLLRVKMETGFDVLAFVAVEGRKHGESTYLMLQLKECLKAKWQANIW